MTQRLADATARQLLEDRPAIGVKVEGLDTKPLKPKQQMKYGTLVPPANHQSPALCQFQMLCPVSFTRELPILRIM